MSESKLLKDQTYLQHPHFVLCLHFLVGLSDSIDIDWKASLAVVYLRRDGRIQRIKCNRCHHAIGKMRETERMVQDLPLGNIAVLLRFISYQGRCSKCGQIETFTLLGLLSKAQATDLLKQHVSHL